MKRLLLYGFGYLFALGLICGGLVFLVWPR